MKLRDVSVQVNQNTRARVSFFNKVIKKEALAQMFSCEFCKFLRTPFLKKHLRKLLLLFVIYLFNYDSSKSTFFMLNMAFDALFEYSFCQINLNSSFRLIAITVTRTSFFLLCVFICAFL